MIRNNNNTKTVLAVLLVGLMVTSMFVPFATMTASADEGDNNDNDGDSQDYTEEYSELVEATDRYHNVGRVHSQLQSDFFSTSGTVGECTDWVVFDYGDAGSSANEHYMGISYCHYEGEIDTAGNDADYGHYWKKNVKFVTAESFEDAKDKMDTQVSDEEDGESFMDFWRKFVFGDGEVVKLVAVDDDGNTEVIKDYTDQEFAMFDYLGENVDGISISDTTDDTTDTVQEESNELEKWMNDATEEPTDTRGSIVDYSYEDKSPVSIYVSRFKDSSTADELLEERSIPPQYTQGSVDTFGEMTQDGGSAKISGNNGLNVGFAALRVPNAQEGAHLVFETKNGQYPDEVEVQVLTRNGLELQDSEFKRVIELDSSVVEYANNNNAVYYVLTSNGKTVQTFNIECSSVVINSNGETDDTPQECNTGTIATGATNFDQTQDSNTNSGENSDTSGSNTGASILDYEVDTEYSESVDYVSSYSDGGDLGYMEKSLGLSEPTGTIQGFPNMIDSDESTSATVTAGDDGLNAGFASQNAPFGENHAFVMKYRVVEGPAPDVTVNTLSNSVKVNGDELQADNSVNTIAIDLTREQELEVSESINRNGVVVVSLQSETSTTKMEIYCASVVANANSKQLDCSGSTDNSDAGTLKDVGTVTDDSQISDAPEADGDDISAYANVKGQVKTNTELTLDASYSDAGQGTIQSYEWTVNGNTYTGESATHTFTSAGTYDVKLKITNNRGETDTTNVPITVSEPTVTEYTYTTSTTNTQTKEATSSPGSDWVQGDKVGTKNIYDYTESTTSPGSNWEQVKQVDTKTIEDTRTKEQHESPGDSWTKVSTVKEVAGGSNSYNFQGTGETEISGSHYVTETSGSGDFYYFYSINEFESAFNNNVQDNGYWTRGDINWQDNNAVDAREDRFAWKYDGWVYAPESGSYSFAVDGDDAVAIQVSGQTVASWWGGHGHGGWHSDGDITLEKGWHRMTVYQEEGGGGEGVEVGWQKPGENGYNFVPGSRIAGQPQTVDASSVHGKEATSSGDGFKNKLTHNHGMMFRAQGDYIEFAEDANDGGLKYEMNAPSNSGTVTVDTKFVANSYEGSGAVLYAVDKDGDRKIIKCDSGVNSIDAPNCDQELGDFTWDGQYEVTMDSEIDRIILAVDMENILGRYYDDGRFYHMDVTSEGEDIYKWETTETTEEPVYEWRKKTGEEDLYTWTKTTTETTTHNTLTEPDSGVSIVGDVSSETVNCSELSAELQQKSSKCGAEA